MYFDFNIYSSLILPSAIHGVIFSILIFNYGRKEKMFIVLSGITLLFTLNISYWLFESAGWNDSRDNYTFFLNYFPFSNIVLSGLLVWYFSKLIENPNFKLNFNNIKTWILPFLFSIFHIVKLLVDFSIFHPFPIESYNNFGTFGPVARIERSNIFLILTQSIFIIYLYFSIINLNYPIAYQRFTRNIKLLILIYFGYSIINILVNFIGIFNPNNFSIIWMNKIRIPFNILYLYIFSIIIFIHTIEFKVKNKFS